MTGATQATPLRLTPLKISKGADMPTDALLRRMYEDFSALPPLENVARSVALDYLAPYNPVHAMIWHLRKNGTCVCLAQYGETESYVGRVYSATEWRALEPVGSLALNAKKEDAATWSADREFVVINLYSQNVLIGFLTVRFAKALNDTQKLKLDSGDCGRALSLYLALRFLEKLEIGNESPMEKQEDRNLSQRQLAILQGLSEAKTNHQISKDLGYSVSTIRHETMRIYEILEVSDRVEAAIVGRRLKFI